MLTDCSIFLLDCQEKRISTLFRRLRLPGEDALNRQRVEDLRISLGPSVVDHDLSKAPFLTVANQLAIVAIHQKRVLGSGTWTFTRHEMLGRHIAIERGGIVADLDLQIARRMTGIERTEQG